MSQDEKALGSSNFKYVVLNLPAAMLCLIPQSSFVQVLYGHFVADYKPRLILYLALSQTAIFIYLFGSFFRSDPRKMLIAMLVYSKAITSNGKIHSHKDCITV